MIWMWMVACGMNPEPPALVPDHCPDVTNPRTLGRLPFPALDEASGLTTSGRHPGVVWSHNDSGGKPVLFAMGLDGTDRGTVRVDGAELRDWEDLTRVGPHLLIGDIGDNDQERASVQIYRVMEPTLGVDTSVVAERMTVRYPDGSHNAESLFAAPNGDLFILTKVKKGGSRLFSLGPFRVGNTTATLVAMHAFDDERKRGRRATGAEVSPDGKWLAVRTYEAVHLFDVSKGMEHAFERSVCAFDPFDVEDGEAITWVGHELVVTYEGDHAPIQAVTLTHR